MTSDLCLHYEWLLDILFLNKMQRIDNKKLLVRTHDCFDSRSEIKKPSTLNKFVQCLGKRKMPIEYGNSEAEEKLKLANYEYTRSTSKRKKEQTQERVFIACLSPLI